LAGARLTVSCNTKPGVAGVQDRVAKPGLAGVTVSVGAPSVCTTWGRAQKPPVRLKLPPLIGSPASDWPRVPLTEKTPPVLVPPPPMVCQGMAN
jgi:hypothetical protein